MPNRGYLAHSVARHNMKFLSNPPEVEPDSTSMQYNKDMTIWLWFEYDKLRLIIRNAALGAPVYQVRDIEHGGTMFTLKELPEDAVPITFKQV